MTELISACETPRVSSLEKSCSAHNYSRSEACAVFDIFFFLTRGTSKSRGRCAPRSPRPRPSAAGRRRGASGRRTRRPRAPRRRCRGRRRPLRSVRSGGEFAAGLGCLADAKCVSGQQEEGRGSEQSSGAGGAAAGRAECKCVCSGERQRARMGTG